MKVYKLIALLMEYPAGLDVRVHDAEGEIDDLAEVNDEYETNALVLFAAKDCE